MIGDMTERAAIITLLILIFICVAVIAGVQAAEMSELARWF